MADRRSQLFLVFSLFLLFVIPGVSSICAPENKDVKVLKEQPYWQFEVSKDLLGCKPFHPPGAPPNVSSTCIFYFSVCQPVPTFCSENSGICLTNKINYGPKYEPLYTMPKNLGSFIPDLNPFKSEPTYFTLTFGPGELLQLNASQQAIPMTTIKFICNQSATWHYNLTDSKVPYPPRVAIKHMAGADLLTYLIEFQYKGACTGGGGGGGGGGGEEEPTKPLSVGSILLILFFPGIFLYCVVGALINRGSGKTGKEMIPNSKFWTELPGLISDGFSFVIAKITCSEMSTSQERYDRM